MWSIRKLGSTDHLARKTFVRKKAKSRKMVGVAQRQEDEERHVAKPDSGSDTLAKNRGRRGARPPGKLETGLCAHHKSADRFYRDRITSRSSRIKNQKGVRNLFPVCSWGKKRCQEPFFCIVGRPRRRSVGGRKGVRNRFSASWVGRGVGAWIPGATGEQSFRSTTRCQRGGHAALCAEPPSARLR